MKRNRILREILSDEELLEKYNMKKSELENLSTSPPYSNKLVETLSVIINDNDNHINDLRIYRKLKNIHNI